MWVSVNSTLRHGIMCPSVVRSVDQHRRQNRKVKHWSNYYKQVLSEVGETDPDHQS